METRREGRYTFPGLPMKVIAHPDEEGLMKKVLKNRAIGGLLEKANDLSVEFFSGVVRGSYVRLTEGTAPDLFRVLEDVCRILNYPKLPQVYVTHLMAQVAVPCGNENPYLVLSDHVLEEYDEDMLYYLLGNAVTMYKAGHVELTNLVNTPGLRVPAPLHLALLAYLRTADMTSDRGGLLASQSLAGTVRCHFLELGLPLCETYRLFRTDQEAEAYVTDYLEEAERVKGRHSGLLENVSETLQNWTYFEGPANRMLSELFRWYGDRRGYSWILRTQGRPADGPV